MGSYFIIPIYISVLGSNFTYCCLYVYMTTGTPVATPSHEGGTDMPDVGI